MIFEKILLKNFGPYLGEQEICVAGPGENNITLVLGQNQVGKTSLLRGIIWCLYGTLIKDDANQDVEILNGQAEEDCQYLASVTIQFKNQFNDITKTFELSRNYEKRFTAGAKGHQSSTNCKLVEIDKHGGRTNIDDSEIKYFIEKLAPEALSKYFFIKGENFAFMQNRSGISDAVKELLGINKIDQIIELVGNLKRTLDREIKNNTPDVQESKLKNEIDGKEADLQRVEKKLEEYQEEIEKTSFEIDTVKGEMEQLFEQSEADGQLKQLQRSIGEEKSRKVALDLDYNKWFQDSLLCLASTKIATAKVMSVNIDELLKDDSASIKITVPSPFKETFIGDVLKNKQCICGRPLEEGSTEFQRVFGLKEKGKDAYVETIFLHARTFASHLSKDLKVSKLRRFKDINNESRNIENKILRLEDERHKLSAKVEGFNRDKFHELETASAQLNTKKNTYRNENRDFLRRKDSLIKELGALRPKYEETIKKDQTRSKVYKKVMALTEIQDFLKAKKVLILDQCRADIEKQVNDILVSSLAQAPKVQVLPNFNYQINDKGIAGGAKRLIDLAFTAAILNINRAGALKGVIIPLVADATLGEVDEDHRKAISRFLPAMAPQLIIMLSGAQAYSFAEHIQGKIGVDYLLKRHYKQSLANETEGEIFYKGTSFKTKIFSQSKEFTEITRMKK